MFDNLVATRTIADEILEAVRFPITLYTKFPECPDVMSIESLFQLRFACSAALTFIVVTVSGITALLSPVGTIVRFISPSPGRTFEAARITRSLLPSLTTIRRTESTRSELAWTASELLAALFTMNSHATVLRMLLTVWGVLLCPFGIALPAAKMVFEPRYAIGFLLHGLTALVTY